MVLMLVSLVSRWFISRRRKMCWGCEGGV
jgi:hypothetical protein